MESEGEFKTLLSALKKAAEISFDTETTGIDANIARLVGMSFSVEPRKGWYVPLNPDNDEQTKTTLERFASLFADEKKPG